MYSRFTDRARKVMQLANTEATQRGHEVIDVPHLLLGVLKEGSGIACAILQSLGVSREMLTQKAEVVLPPGTPLRVSGRLPQTPNARAVVHGACAVASAWQANYVGTEMLLAGIVRVCPELMPLTEEQIRQERERLVQQSISTAAETDLQRVLEATIAKIGTLHALSQVRLLSPKPGDILVCRYPRPVDENTHQAIVKCFKETWGEQLCVFVPHDYALSLLDEDAMRQHGWVREKPTEERPARGGWF